MTNNLPAGTPIGAADVEKDNVDPYDLFDTSISTIFSIPPIAFSPSSSSGLYTWSSPTGQNIPLRIPNPPAQHQKLQANQIWLAGLYLSEWISLQTIDLKGKRVAELGAGAGLPSVVAAIHGAEVVCTDWGVEEVLSALKDNLEVEGKRKGRAAVVGHEWGTDVAPILHALSPNGPKRFDAVLMADTLWITSAHQALLDTVFRLLKPDGEGMAHIYAGLHTGRGPVERFREAARSRGASVSDMEEVRWSRGSWEPYERKDGLEEERGVVVSFTMTI